MKKMKSVIAIFIALTFILSLGTTSVFADNNKANGNNGRTRIPYGIAKKAFDDLEKFPWAQQAIEKMRLKGLLKGKEDGKFAPAASVTKLESVIMALRVMGWENETNNLTNLPKKYKGKEVSQWAKGYVALAFDKGILDDVDMMYFNPEEPAQRHEVAKYVIRALGYEDEAKDHMDEDLPFTDASAIPQGSIGYVHLANQMKLMVGDDGRFNPMGTLTRAEMAVLFQRLDKNVDNDIDGDEYVGQIHRISEQSITLTINGKLKTFDVDEDVVVYDNNNKIRYSKLKADDFVIVQLENDKVVYIEITDKNAQDDKIISQYAGTVTAISQSTNKITVQIDKMQAIFEATDDALVTFKGIEGSFDEILVGDSVNIIVDTRNRAREIRVDRNRQEQSTRELNGIITKIDLIGTYYLYIDSTRYALDETADVQISGKTSSVLEDLKVGFDVVCTLKDNKITNIEVENTLTSVSGVITKIDLAGTYYLYIDSTRYLLDESADVQISGKTSSVLEDLKVGFDVVCTLKDNKITNIEVENTLTSVSGVITKIDLAGTYYLYIDSTHYLLDESADVQISGKSNSTLEDLDVGNTVKCTVENDKITKIEVDS